MAFGEIFLAGHSGQSRAGKIAPSCPLGQPITGHSVHLARSWSLAYNNNYSSFDFPSDSWKQNDFPKPSNYNWTKYFAQGMMRISYSAVSFCFLEEIFSVYCQQRFIKYIRYYSGCNWSTDVFVIMRVCKHGCAVLDSGNFQKYL